MPDATVSLRIGARALEATAPLWRRLEAEEEPPPFQTLGWAKAWLTHLGGGAEPWIALVGEPAAGLLALALRRVSGVRVLSLLGHGTSDYLGPLGSARDPERLEAIARALRRESRRFDLVDLLSLHADPAQRAALARGLGRGARERAYERCPLVRIDGSWEDYLKTRSANQRKNAKRLARRVGAHGDVVIEQEKPSAELFEQLVEVERASWKWEHGLSSLRDPARRAFLREILLGGGVRHELWTCRVEASLAAFAIVLLGGRTRYYYLASFREDVPRVGSLLLQSLLEKSFAGGVNEFDFLQGDEPYKFEWANAEREAHQLVAAGGGWLAVPALAAVRTRWWLARSERLRRLRTRLLPAFRRSPEAAGPRSLPGG
jgi:CelD/BcsL family acetyltransferase involved in cellulose biosynthesis